MRSDVQAFQKAVTQLPGILEVHHIAGAFDYLLRVAVSDLASYETFHADCLTALPGVAHITSYVVMSKSFAAMTLHAGRVANGSTADLRTYTGVFMNYSK